VDDEVVPRFGLDSHRRPGEVGTLVDRFDARIHRETHVSSDVRGDGTRDALERGDYLTVRSVDVRVYCVHTLNDTPVLR
jgi:hypothetical protein